jgi:hypothetical protein
MKRWLTGNQLTGPLERTHGESGLHSGSVGHGSRVSLSGSMGCGSSPEIHWNHRKSLEDRTSDDPAHRSGSTSLTGSQVSARVCYGSLGFSSSPVRTPSPIASLSLSDSLRQQNKEEERRKEEEENEMDVQHGLCG